VLFSERARITNFNPTKEFPLSKVPYGKHAFSDFISFSNKKRHHKNGYPGIALQGNFFNYFSIFVFTIILFKIYIPLPIKNFQCFLLAAVDFK
jgi:hypothetical protein